MMRKQGDTSNKQIKQEQQKNIPFIKQEPQQMMMMMKPQIKQQQQQQQNPQIKQNPASTTILNRNQNLKPNHQFNKSSPLVNIKQ